jgi:hypothetical protein
MNTLFVEARARLRAVDFLPRRLAALVIPPAMRSERAVALVAAALTLLASPLALAQGGGPPAMPEPPEDTTPPAPRPTAPDTRTGHPTLALQFGLLRLAGSAEVGRSHGSVIGWGQAPGLQLTYPFRRDFAVELWGSYATFGGSSGCAGDCKGSSLALGVGAVYHMVDGSPFDPWFSAGVGYRQTSLEAPSLGVLDYGGLTALRLVMGSDYYPSPAIGFGPYLELSAGRYLTRSPGPLAQGAGHVSFGTGLRVVLSPF